MDENQKIGSGAQANIFLLDGFAIKTFKQGYEKSLVLYEALVNSIIEKTGLPIAKVHEVSLENTLYSIKMDYIKGITLTDKLLQDPENAFHYIDMMVDLQIRIHSIKPQFPLTIKQRLTEKIGCNSLIDDKKKQNLIEKLNGLPNGDSLCHNDFHGYNIIVADDENYVIDWIDATIGDPNADACRTYMLYCFYGPQVADLYLMLYCEKQNIDKQAVLDWLPVVAAARLSENILNEKEQILAWINAGV